MKKYINQSGKSANFQFRTQSTQLVVHRTYNNSCSFVCHFYYCTASTYASGKCLPRKKQSDNNMWFCTLLSEPQGNLVQK